MDGFRFVVYVMAVFASIACAVMQFRAYQQRRAGLLKWSAVFFAFLTLSNMAVFVDAAVFPGIDLRLARLVPTVMGSACLLYGFIWDLE